MKELYKSITPKEYLVNCYEAMLYHKPIGKLYYEIHDGTFCEVYKTEICYDEIGVPALNISVCWSDIEGNSGGIFEVCIPNDSNWLFIKCTGDESK